MSTVEVAVCLLPGASRLAAQAVVELLEAANGLLAEPRYRVSLGALQDIAMDRPWDQLWLLAPWRSLAASDALATLPALLQRLAERKALIAGLEGGVLWLAAAGLLNSRRANGVDWLHAHLQQQHPAVIWSQGLWEIDATPGRVLLPSCSRPLAVPDLLLALLAREHGDAFARQLAGRLGLSALRARDERVLGEAAGHALMPPKLAEALALMQANLAEPLPTDEVARLVGLSRRQLERLFKQHMDALPSRHYLELRLQRSRELLQRTGQSILPVGLACGFSSGPHFSNAYKLAFGCTPRDERARDALQGLAAAASPGIGSLRNDRAQLAQRIARSLQAFVTEDEDVSGEESYLFVLEQRGRLIGCAGIAARAGFGSRFYSYRNEFVVASSAALGLTQRTHTLHLCHDLTGATLLTSFFIVPGAADAAAQLLSRARLLFLQLHTARFSDRIVAEFPGLLDAEGSSPFWDAVGRRFFAMDYPQAEAVAGGRSKAFIADLMPQSPLYVPLLPEAAQRAIGQLHPDGELPFEILLAEGFDAESYIDIFDGGPTAEGRLQALRSPRAARPLAAGEAAAEDCIACSFERDGFRARLLPAGAPADQALLATPLEAQP